MPIEVLDDERLGHNRPPADEDPLVTRLLEDHDALFTRAGQLLKAGERVPATLDDEVTVQRVQDFVKQVAACIKAGKSIHEAEKEPFLAGCRKIDTLFFGRIRDPLTELKKRIEARLTTYLRAKAEAERRAREEAERKAREEAERARREAEEAAERARREAEAARLENEADLEREIEAEAARKRQQEEAERRAAQARAEAERAARDAAAKAAELSRTRGEQGSVASLRTQWIGIIEDRDALDLEALRPHLPEDGLEKALRSFIRAGGRQLRGARIFEDTVAVVR